MDLTLRQASKHDGESLWTLHRTARRALIEPSACATTRARVMAPDGCGSTDVARRCASAASTACGRRAATGPLRAGVAFVLALVAIVAFCSGCALEAGPTPGPSLASASPAPDDGWTVAGRAEFLPTPVAGPAGAHDAGPTLVAATGARARVKWLADRAGVARPRDASSTFTLHVVDLTDPHARADVRFRGAAGAGTVDLPIEPGKRTLYRLSYEATGTYRRCSVLIEVHE